MLRRFIVPALAAVLVAPVPAARAQLFSAAGANAAAITSTRDAFRAAVGGGTVPGGDGSFGGARREINWDGVSAGFAAPNNLPADFFNTTSPRGVVFATPGSGFRVSGATTDAGAGQPAALNFGDIDASYASTFAPFSAQRLFTAVGSNVVDVRFFVPGTSTAAVTTAFGAIFSDVDLANTTAIQFFDAANVSLGTFFAPVGGFSFLGAQFAQGIGRVRITAGNRALGAGVVDNGTTNDLVVMDDFIYGEPLRVAAVPEPATLALLGGGLAVLAAVRRRRA